MCGDITIEQNNLESPGQSAKVSLPVGYVGSEDLPSFVSTLLDQYDEEDQLLPRWPCGEGVRLASRRSWVRSLAESYLRL